MLLIDAVQDRYANNSAHARARHDAEKFVEIALKTRAF
jgi:hypothetical protein